MIRIIISVKGSQTPFYSKIEHSLDCKINVATAGIQSFFFFFFFWGGGAIFKLNAFVLYMILNFYEILYINFINCIL